MPFGFDPHDAEKAVKEIHDELNITYVEVTVKWDKDGKMTPLTFSMDDKSIIIDKVISMREGHSLKAFSRGLRYYCQVKKRKFYLHFDGERWYIETKGPQVNP
jgi:hypothetical protein